MSTVRHYKGMFITTVGEVIRPGEYIKMSFMLSPHDMPIPWTLVKAEAGSPDNYEFHGYVNVTVRAADGTEKTFKDNGGYDIRGANYDDCFDKFIENCLEFNADKTLLRLKTESLTRTDRMNRIFGRGLAARIRRRTLASNFKEVYPETLTLPGAFKWSETPEGAEFWMAVDTHFGNVEF